MGRRGTDIEDDDELWARVAETAAPLKNRNRVTEVATPPKPMPPRKTKPAKATQTASVDPGTTPRAPKMPRVGHAPAPGLDRQTARKLGKGQIAVEARLDLHGMRQREAHVALRKFLKWAQRKDYRHVLVITGKGSARDTDSFYDEEPRGVLRNAVPRWLEQRDLAPLVVSYSEAPRRLGGEGAIYVRVRRGR